MNNKTKFPHVKMTGRRGPPLPPEKIVGRIDPAHIWPVSPAHRDDDSVEVIVTGLVVVIVVLAIVVGALTAVLLMGAMR